jgi:hypothetical protein
LIRLCCAALLCLAAAALPAATLDARSLAYLPVVYSAGEEVLAQALLAPEGREKLAELDLKPGSGLPPAGLEADPELRELRLSKTASGWLLSLRFVPWSPGTSSLPPMRAKGFLIPAVPYSASSILGPEDRDPSPPRRQRDPPGTALYLYALAGILVAIALGAAGASAYLLPAARALIARRRAAQAFRRLATSLDFLAAEAPSADPAAFLAALSRALRLYLGSRVVSEAPALTAAELALLPEASFPAPATRTRVAALIAGADRLRYGGGAVGLGALEAAVAEARSICAANEEALLARP